VQEGWTPLHAAAQEGRLQCIQLLVDKGAEVDAADEASPALQLHHHESVSTRRMKILDS
jgi:ankyrin repeat protein